MCPPPRLFVLLFDGVGARLRARGTMLHLACFLLPLLRFTGYGGEVIKQGDAVLLGFPLGFDYGAAASNNQRQVGAGRRQRVLIVLVEANMVLAPAG